MVASPRISFRRGNLLDSVDIREKDVTIFSDTVKNLKHEVIFMPLAYTMQTQIITEREEKSRDIIEIVPGHTYARFQVYNTYIRIRFAVSTYYLARYTLLA